MSTSVLAPQAIAAEQSGIHLETTRQAWPKRLLPFGLILLLTALSLAVHGYHPYAEDGGLYATGIKRLLNPTLYTHSQPFVDAHLRYSLFAPAIATLVHLTHASLATVLLFIHLASIAATLSAVWLLVRRLYTNQPAHLGAVTLTAAWLTLPVAGTSLILVDPYVTARSISLPCTLFALAATLDLLQPGSTRKRLSLAILCAVLLLAAITHPLMAAYALADVLLLAAVLSRIPSIRLWGSIALCCIAFIAAAILEAGWPPDPAVYIPVAITRYYWFLSRWQWYELIGLAAPLLILAAVAFYGKPRAFEDKPQAARRALARVAITSGITAVLVSIAFAHESSAAHIVARLQPLRTFQTIYMLMILVLGAILGEYLLRSHPWRWIVTFTLLGTFMFHIQRSTYPASAHIEWPGTPPANSYEQAFLWISRHTPIDALFAMDADYISEPAEDAQSFRAIAERSALPDYSKDGGEASITPSLAPAWTAGQLAQANLSTQADAQRLSALRPLNADWVMLRQHAQTSFDCPYTNDRVKVCRLP